MKKLKEQKFKEVKLSKPKKLKTVIKSIFDEEDISDLPENVKNQIVSKKKNKEIRKYASINSNSGKVYMLFKICPRLTTSQILIGLYREYKLELNHRYYISSTISNFIRSGVLIRVERGIYERGPDFDSVIC